MRGDEDTDSEKKDAIDEDEVVDEAVLGKQMRFMEVDEESAPRQVQEVESEFDELVAGAHRFALAVRVAAAAPRK